MKNLTAARTVMPVISKAAMLTSVSAPMGVMNVFWKRFSAYGYIPLVYVDFFKDERRNVLISPILSRFVKRDFTNIDWLGGYRVSVLEVISNEVYQHGLKLENT